MTGVVLFPPETSGNTTLTLLSTPKKPKTKRQKPPSSPPPSSNLHLQYKKNIGRMWRRQMLVFNSRTNACANFGVDRADSNQRNPVPAVHATVPKPSPLLDYFKLPSDLSPDMNAWGDLINEDPKDLHLIYFQNRHP
jgi:hypothetical protein